MGCCWYCKRLWTYQSVRSIHTGFFIICIKLVCNIALHFQRNKVLILANNESNLALSIVYFLIQPVSEEFQNGEGFGYIVAFRANGTRGWKEKMVTSADSTTYKYRDETFPPLTPFEVKVGVYNNKGDGPFSKVVTVFSAEGGKIVEICAHHLVAKYNYYCLHNNNI